MEMVRVKSADSPLSAVAGVKLLPKEQVYVRSCSSLSSHVMFLLLSCAVEGGSRVSRTRTREVPLGEGACIFAVAAVVYVGIYYYSRARKGVCDGGGQGRVHRLQSWP